MSFNRSQTTVARTCAVLLITASLVAQKAPTPQEIDGAVLLAKAMKKMTKLDSVRFDSEARQDSALLRQVAKQIAAMGAPGGAMGGQSIEVSGVYSQGIIHASFGDGGPEILTHGRRTVSRCNGNWKLQRDIKEGFVFDPQLFFEALAQLPEASRKIQRVEHKDVVNGKRIVISLSLRDDPAIDFAKAGAVPEIESPMGGMMKRLGPMAAAMGGGFGDPDTTIDLAIEIDPVTSLVHRVRSASYQSSPAAGAFMAAPQGGGMPGLGDEEDEEEEDEEKQDEAKQPGYRRGLPVRKLTKDLSKSGFTVTFRDHQKPHAFKLDGNWRELLHVAGKIAGKK